MISVDTLASRVARTIERYRMFESGSAVAVAVSGGADSVCLLHVLGELAPRWGLALSVLHLNHQLRGEESQGDAEFVRGLAASMGLPFTARAVEVAAVPDNLEQAAREARLAFFREVLGSGSAQRVAVGHTRTDQAETVLFRFLRGAGTAGLAGIRPVLQEGIVRPLIAVDRSEVEAYLRERGIVWREDSTNRSLEFARNRIRHELIPQLAREWNPAIGEMLANAADWALAEEEYWESEIGRLAGDYTAERDGAVLVKVWNLRELPLAAARRLVRRAMEKVKGDLRAIDFHHVSAVLEMAESTEGHGRMQAPGLDIIRSFDWLRIGRPGEDNLATRNYRISVEAPGTTVVTVANLLISLEMLGNGGTSDPSESVYNDEMGCLDWDLLPGPLELRNWRPGDQYQPLGSTGEEKIKTLFQQARIPLWERRHWPILTSNSSIVWARRFGPAAQFAAGPDCRLRMRVRDAQVG